MREHGRTGRVLGPADPSTPSSHTRLLSRCFIRGLESSKRGQKVRSDGAKIPRWVKSRSGNLNWPCKMYNLGIRLNSATKSFNPPTTRYYYTIFVRINHIRLKTIVTSFRLKPSSGTPKVIWFYPSTNECARFGTEIR